MTTRGSPGACPQAPVAATAPAKPVLRELYSRQALETFAAGEHEAFVRAGGRPLRPRQARCLALAALAPGVSIVDVGCGRGECAIHAARRGAHVIALDYSRGAISTTLESLQAVLGESAARRRIDVLASDAGALPLGSSSADRVLLLDVVEHLHPWQLDRVLRETVRILAPGGYVVIHTVPNRWSLTLTYRLARIFAPELPSEARSGYEKAVHVNEQDPLKLRQTLVRAGFEARVWVEEWTTRHAAAGMTRDYPDPARAVGYPVLRRRAPRRVIKLLMASPARWIVANDVFALAWPRGGQAPELGRRCAPLR